MKINWYIYPHQRGGGGPGQQHNTKSWGLGHWYEPWGGGGAQQQTQLIKGGGGGVLRTDLVKQECIRNCCCTQCGSLELIYYIYLSCQHDQLVARHFSDRVRFEKRGGGGGALKNVGLVWFGNKGGGGGNKFVLDKLTVY